MPSRPRRPIRPAAAPARPGSAPDPGPCPCGAGEGYAECCGRYHRGDALAPTAEALMRSRYTAFAVHDTAYLIRSWHPSTRPHRLELGTARRYTRLEIVGKAGGGLFDDQGEVRFRAHYVENGDPGVQEENSRFVREDGAWLYVAAISDAVRR